jgi:hypothetical protein
MTDSPKYEGLNTLLTAILAGCAVITVARYRPHSETTVPADPRPATTNPQVKPAEKQGEEMDWKNAYAKSPSSTEQSRDYRPT